MIEEYLQLDTYVTIEELGYSVFDVIINNQNNVVAYKCYSYHQIIQIILDNRKRNSKLHQMLKKTHLILNSYE